MQVLEILRSRLGNKIILERSINLIYRSKRPKNKPQKTEKKICQKYFINKGFTRLMKRSENTLTSDSNIFKIQGVFARSLMSRSLLTDSQEPSLT